VPFANLLPSVVTWTVWSGAGVATAGQPDPYGGTEAALLTDNDAGSYEGVRDWGSGYVSGEPLAVELWVKKAAGPVTHFSGTNLNFDGTALLQVLFRHDTGEALVTLGSATDVEMVEAVTGWWRLRFRHAGSAAAVVSIDVYPASGLISDGFPSGNLTATGSITVYGAYIRILDISAPAVIFAPITAAHISPTQSIRVSLADDYSIDSDSLRIAVEYTNGCREPVWGPRPGFESPGFLSPFLDSEEVTGLEPISGVARAFIIRRDRRWPAGFSVIVSVADEDGNES
jgi:hypothetical protein